MTTTTTSAPKTTHAHARARYTPPVLPHVAALYARVSSTRQGQDDKASLPTQLAAMRTKAEELGYTTCEEYTYVEKHTGEELYERPALSRLRDDAKRRPFAPFGLVLCYSVERLARNSAYVQICLDEWERLGITLQFATEELEDTALGRAILNMRAYAGEVESERKKDRVQRALLDRVRSGKPIVASRPTYGYAWEDLRRADGRLARERLVEDPVTAPIVRRIWQMADDGMTMRQIAGTLTREGIPLPSGRIGVWDPTTVRYILRNSIYWGEPVALKRQKVPVEKAVRQHYRHNWRDVPRPVEEQVPLPATLAPVLVSKEMAMRVHARLQQNQALAARNNTHPDASILRGLVVCGACGSHMSIVNCIYRRKRDNPGSHAVWPQFRCSRHQRLAGLSEHAPRCGRTGNTIMAARLDADVWAQVIALFQTPGALSRELAKAHQHASQAHAEASAPVDDLTSKILDAEKRLANLRAMAELVDSNDEREALAGRITLLARDRDTWTRELVGRAAAAAKPRQREDAIRAFQRRLASAHGDDMSAWVGNLMRQFLLILDARVEVWPKGEVDEGRAAERAVLHLDLPLAGPRHLALTRLLGSQTSQTGADTMQGDAVRTCDEHGFTRSTTYT